MVVSQAAVCHGVTSHALSLVRTADLRPCCRNLCLAGVKQNYARRCTIPIDAITFDFTCMPPDAHPEAAPAEGGAYVSGMFVEGARWDPEAAQLAESQPKVRGLRAAAAVHVQRAGAVDCSHATGVWLTGAWWQGRQFLCAFC